MYAGNSVVGPANCRVDMDCECGSVIAIGWIVASGRLSGLIGLSFSGLRSGVGPVSQVVEGLELLGSMMIGVKVLGWWYQVLGLALVSVVESFSWRWGGMVEIHWATAKGSRGARSPDPLMREVMSARDWIV